MAEKIELYDKVILANGRKAQIVEILSGGEMYVADVSMADGWEDDDTIFVSPDEIAHLAGNLRMKKGPANGALNTIY